MERRVPGYTIADLYRSAALVKQFFPWLLCRPVLFLPGVINHTRSPFCLSRQSRGLRSAGYEDGGAWVETAEGIRESVPSLKVNAVDTTSAGGAFNGAFVRGLMLGMGATKPAQFAAAVAVSVTRAGEPSMT